MKMIIPKPVVPRTFTTVGTAFGQSWPCRSQEDIGPPESEAWLVTFVAFNTGNPQATLVVRTGGKKPKKIVGNSDSIKNGSG